MRISDWSSDVCSSDLVDRHPVGAGLKIIDHLTHNVYGGRMAHWAAFYERIAGFREIRYFDIKGEYRSEEHTSELQSLMRISYAVFCLKKKKNSQYSAEYEKNHVRHTLHKNTQL